nr:SAM-dependent methyltransferase [Streptomyces otsuchiensis]
MDTTTPHSARVWNYWLGGQDHYPVDREVGDAYRKQFPGIDAIAKASREFLARAVRYLVQDGGIRQFLDVGTGLPTHDNTHQIAQRYAPDARIVYVDHDPLVLLHAEALLTSTPQGSTTYLEADLHDPAAVLAGALTPVGPLSRAAPIALILSDVLGHVPDHDTARDVVRRLVDGLPPGSYLMICHGTTESPDAALAAQDAYNSSGAIPYIPRTRDQIRDLFGGLELVAPGLVPVPDWRPAIGPAAITPGAGLGAIARIPR